MLQNLRTCAAALLLPAVLATSACVTIDPHAMVKQFEMYRADDRQVEIVDFTSYNAPLAAHILDRSYLEAPVDIAGTLYLPLRPAPVPVVVMMHDSAGPANFVQENKRYFHAKIIDGLIESGIGVFLVDSFSARGIQSSLADQSRVSLDAMVLDALMAYRTLAADPRIDADRIGIAGHSRGGKVSLMVADRRYTDAVLGPGRHFAAAMPMAASCHNLLFAEPNPAATKIQLFHGTADDYTPVSFCIDYAAKMKRAGADIDTVFKEGWYHGFMGARAPATCSQCVHFNRCPVPLLYGDDGWPTAAFRTYLVDELDVDYDSVVAGIDADLTTDRPLRTFQTVYRKLYFQCGSQGATVGGGHIDESAAIFTAFFRRALGTSD